MEYVEIIAVVGTGLLAVAGIFVGSYKEKFKGIVGKAVRVVSNLDDLVRLCDDALKDNKLTNDEVRSIVAKIKELGVSSKAILE